MKTVLCLLVGVLALSLVGCTSSVEKNKAAMESPVVVKSKADDRLSGVWCFRGKGGEIPRPQGSIL